MSELRSACPQCQTLYWELECPSCVTIPRLKAEDAAQATQIAALEQRLTAGKCGKCGRDAIAGDCYGCEVDRLRTKLAALEADQKDWRKGVELIASALAYENGLSCVGIADAALTLRAHAEALEAKNAELRKQLDVSR